VLGGDSVSQVWDEAGKTRSVAVANRLLEEWRALVEEVEDGYWFNIYEYDNDLTARESIDRHLRDDPHLPAWIAAELDEIDRRFRAVLTPDPVDARAGVPWWRAHVPRHAGSELAADIEERYGVKVAVRD
jgi:hypothetical protein